MDFAKQRRLENTLRLLDFLRQGINNDQIATFIKLFNANSELAGASYNEFKFADGDSDTIETMFSEGGCGNGDIYNIIATLNAIAPMLGTTKEQIIWYEYGQIMDKIYSWTKYLEENTDQKDHVSFYSSFNLYMKKNVQKILSTTFKYYIYAEL